MPPEVVITKWFDIFVGVLVLFGVLFIYSLIPLDFLWLMFPWAKKPKMYGKQIAVIYKH